MAMTTMTLAKAILVAKAGLAAAAAALALTACGPAPAGAPVAPAMVAPPATGAPAARRLLQAASPAATLWGLDFRSTHLAIGKVVVRTPKWMEKRGRKPFWHDAESRVETVVLGWETNKTFAGDGDLEDLTGGRFLYVVPAGRVLIVNRVVNPHRVAINGYNLAGLAGDDVHFVFGPGEAVLFSLPVSPDASQLRGYDAKIQGYTADPALLGGAGLGGGAFAK